MTRTIGPGGKALVVGASGGVARAVLAVLAHTAVGRALSARLDELLLLDAVHGPEAPRRLARAPVPSQLHEPAGPGSRGRPAV
jgi:hypothetical protein